MAEFTYPSVGGPAYEHLGQPCLAFEKHDGSNLRFFWDHQRGWHSTGTRYKWFKAATPTFGPAVELFQRAYADGVVAVLRRLKDYRGVAEAVAFCEYFGPGTFSGLHRDGDVMRLVMFDVYLPGRGLVPPKDFVAHFGHLDIARVVYDGPFSKAFIANVQDGKFPVAEGVVAKGTVARRQRKGPAAQDVWMAKVKTRAWLAELARRAGDSADMQREYEQNVREQQVPAGPPG